MKLNSIVAVSNITCIFPLWLSWTNNDILTFNCILFVSLMSFISHLIENHKHGMIGIQGISIQISYFFNRLDVLGCIIVTIRLLYIYFSLYGLIIHPYLLNFWLLFFSGFLLFCNARSEYDKHNVKLQSEYIFFHILWHLGVFIVLYKLLANVIYV